jgi:hypothetical protein
LLEKNYSFNLFFTLSSFNFFKNRSFEILIISFMKTKVHVSLYNFFVLLYIIIDFLQLSARHKYPVAYFFAKNNTKRHVIPWKVHLRQLLFGYLLSRHLLQALCFLHILGRTTKSHKNATTPSFYLPTGHVLLPQCHKCKYSKSKCLFVLPTKIHVRLNQQVQTCNWSTLWKTKTSRENN